MKRCFKCRVLLPLSEFYKHPMMADGHLGKCKTCAKRDVKENYVARREQYARYERKRNKKPERRAAAIIYQRNGRARNPERKLVRQIVTHAMRSGKLTRKPCRICGSTKKIQAHHPDYSRPLDVEWLCFVCHREHAHGQTVSKRMRSRIQGAVQ